MVFVLVGVFIGVLARYYCLESEMPADIVLLVLVAEICGQVLDLLDEGG